MKWIKRLFSRTGEKETDNLAHPLASDEGTVPRPAATRAGPGAASAAGLGGASSLSPISGPSGTDDRNDRRQIRVFISSTFRDMMRERDLLVKEIFPELRRKCAKRFVTFTEVDLRWGIAQQQGQGLVVTGESGGGKTVLLAAWARDWAKDHPEDFLFQHYFDATPDIRRALKALMRPFGMSPG